MANRTLHMLHSLDIKPGDIGVTVRRGTHWASATKGQELDLCVCVPACKIVDTGFVNAVHVCSFKDVPARLLQYEHEEESRSYGGLLKSMRRAYGIDFDENEEVTVLVYTRKNH